MYSVSKSWTSTAAGFAVNEGLLSLDDKVISFFRMTFRILSLLTFQNLL
jgi:CubicO group peptidase (beta-lactamase class C family)